MGWFDNLKSLISAKVDLSNLKSIKFSIGNNNQHNSLFKLENNSKHLHITLGSDILEDSKKRKLAQEIIRSAVSEAGIPVLEEHASATLEDISSNHKYEELLNYFTDKIPHRDIPILRAALYMRKLHDEGKHVDAYKQDIVSTYGQRGANIANLCSAGYFESHIQPMYEELRQRPNFTQQLFIDNYDLIIEKAPFAVFVSGVKSDSELSEEVSQKLVTNRMYGIHQLNIHAIGTENVRKLRELIQKPEIAQHFTDEPAISIEGSIMNVQIFF